MTVFSREVNLRFISFPSHCRKDGLLASSCFSVYPNVRINSAPTGRMYVKFDIGNFGIIQSRICNFVKIVQKHQELYVLLTVHPCIIL